MFEEKYRSGYIVHARAQEFIELTQGNSSVKDYTTRFNVLARFVPGVATSESIRVQKFVHGLHPAIARDVMTGSSPPQRFSEALGRALRSEVYLQRMGFFSR